MKGQMRELGMGVYISQNFLCYQWQKLNSGRVRPKGICWLIYLKPPVGDLGSGRDGSRDSNNNIILSSLSLSWLNLYLSVDFSFSLRMGYAVKKEASSPGLSSRLGKSTRKRHFSNSHRDWLESHVHLWRQPLIPWRWSTRIRQVWVMCHQQARRGGNYGPQLHQNYFYKRWKRVGLVQTGKYLSATVVWALGTKNKGQKMEPYRVKLSCWEKQKMKWKVGQGPPSPQQRALDTPWRAYLLSLLSLPSKSPVDTTQQQQQNQPNLKISKGFEQRYRNGQ